MDQSIIHWTMEWSDYERKNKITQGFLSNLFYDRIWIL